MYSFLLVLSNLVNVVVLVFFCVLCKNLFFFSQLFQGVTLWVELVALQGLVPVAVWLSPVQMNPQFHCSFFCIARKRGKRPNSALHTLFGVFLCTCNIVLQNSRWNFSIRFSSLFLFLVCNSGPHISLP